MKLRRAVLALAGLLAVAAVLAIGGGAMLSHQLHRPHAGWDGDDIVVNLEPGLGAGAMFSRLSDAGVLDSPELLRAWLRWRGGGDNLRAGEYRFDRALSPIEVLQRLERGDVVLHPITLPEGLTVRQVADRLADAGFGTREELLRVFADPSWITDLDPNATDLEGYLFPETYRFRRGATAEEVGRAMVQRFRDETGSAYAARARERNLTLRQAVTLASMIEKETARGSERALISRVFHNRLERGMRMQCDPTVIYAIERTGRTVGRLTYKDLEFDSPWNTYRVHGLPRGPIASPGLASLEAAVAPTDSEALYFVASPEGGHRFSNSLSQHQRAVAEWRRYSRSSR